MEEDSGTSEKPGAVHLSGIELGAVALGTRGLGVEDYDITVSIAGGGKEIIVQAADDLAEAS